MLQEKNRINLEAILPIFKFRHLYEMIRDLNIVSMLFLIFLNFESSFANLLFSNSYLLIGDLNTLFNVFFLLV